MQRAQSPHFATSKSTASKQLTFSTTPFSTKKASPLRASSHKATKSQQILPPSRQQTYTSPQRATPPPHHAYLKKKDEEMTRHHSAMRSFGGSFNGATMYSTMPNALSQNFSPKKGVEARLQDLCTEDKQKIGDLIKKLAEEKEEKERLRKELERKDSHYNTLIHNLAKENDGIVKDSIELQNQFKYSLELLKNFQDHSVKHERDKSKEAKRQRKLRKQREEEEKQQLLLRQQEDERQAKERERQKELDKRRYEQEQQKREYLLQQQREQQEELERLRQQQYQQQQLLQHQRSPVTKNSPIRKVLASPSLKPNYVDEPRHLIPIEAGKTELALLHENITQKIKSPAKAAADATFEREQGVMNEITKLRKDIEELTHSFKKINFSPGDSQNARDYDQVPTEASTQKKKQSSPIKLVQNIKPVEGSRKKLKQQQQQMNMEEDQLYEDLLQPETLPVQPAKQRESLNRAAGMKKGSSVSMSTANPPYRYEPSSTSSDDEFEVMQKWLNLRKDKIQKINQELNENRGEREREKVPQKGRYYAGEKQETNHSEQYPNEIVQQYYHSEPKQSMDQQYSQPDWTGDRGEGLYQQKGWIKTSPSVREANSGKFRKKDSYSFQDQDSMRKGGLMGSARGGNDSAGIVNLNQLSLNDMIQLKTVLEEKIKHEKPQDLIDSKVEYAIRSPQKAHSIMNPLNSQTFSYQGTYPELSKSGSSAKNSRLIESGYDQDRFKYAVRSLPNEGVEYERSSKKGLGDSTIVRDFDSIEYTRPDTYKVTESYKDTGTHYDGFELVTEAPKTLEDDTSQFVDEQLYNEKLREFLKVQERMLKQNRIREQGVNTGDIALNNKFGDIRRPHQVNRAQNSAQRSGYTNSPPSVRSMEKLEANRSHEKDHFPGQNTDYVLRSQQQGNGAAKFFKESQDSPVKNLEEAKTPDYGYGVSQRSMTEGENREEGGDDFYDDGLFELVDDIELKESAKPTPNASVKPEWKSTLRTKEMKSVENEFNSLFNTVRSMFTNTNDDNTTTERIREKLLNKVDKSDLMTSKLSSEREDESESYMNLPQQVLGRGNFNERRTSDLSGRRTHGRPSKTDSSLVETDTSILAISKKIDELKKNKKAQK